MATRPAHPRPRSPHLFSGFLQLHYRWGPHMLVSILHRATGDAMATIGFAILVWWLAAIAGGPASYATFLNVFTTASGKLNVIGWIIGVGFTWSLFQHMASGVRHLVMDTGAAFELKANKAFAIATMLFSAIATIAFWAYILGGK